MEIRLLIPQPSIQWSKDPPERIEIGAHQKRKSNDDNCVPKDFLSRRICNQDHFFLYIRNLDAYRL